MDGITKYYQDSLVADLVRHDVDGLEVSALVDCAGGGREAHAGHRGQAHHLAGDLHIPGQDVDIETRQDDRVIPVEKVAVPCNVLRCLPLKILSELRTTFLICDFPSACRLTHFRKYFFKSEMSKSNKAKHLYIE